MNNMKLPFLVSVFLLVTGQAVYGTTVEKLTFDELVGRSQRIVQGEVTDVELVRSHGLQYTRVQIRVDDVLKGDPPGEFVELYYLGGKEGGEAVLQVSGQDIPEVHERGFYFIERTDGQSVNPLTGWSQGHFRILTDARGHETLETDIRQDVVELGENKNAALARKLRQMKFAGALVEKSYFSPVTPEDLREAVYGILDGNH